MKRLLMAMLVVGLAAGAARADWGGRGAAPANCAPAPQIGGPNTLLGMGEPANGVAPDKYGLHPKLKRLFSFGGRGSTPDYGAMGYGQMGPAYNPNGYPPGAFGPAQGTLVFPNHPYVRSPRDYFMYDLNR